MKRRSFFAAILASALALPLHPQAYTILAEDAAGLWGRPDGTGCANDIVVAAFAASGVEVRLEVMPYNRAKILVTSGKALACFGMGWSEELAGKVVFASEPIYTTTSVVFARAAKAVAWSASRLPRGTTVGTVLGYEYPATFVRLVKAGIVVPDPSPSEEQSLRKLALGRVDLAITSLDSLKSADFLLREAGVEDKVRQAFDLGGSGTYLGFCAARPETPAAMRAFDAGMAAIRADGRLARIVASWQARR